MTDTTPAKPTTDDLLDRLDDPAPWPQPWTDDPVEAAARVIRTLRRELAGANAMLDVHAQELRLICGALDIPIPKVNADPIIQAVATLRRELVEARAWREAVNDGLYRRGYGHVDADWLLGKVDEAKRLRKERDEARDAKARALDDYAAVANAHAERAAKAERERDEAVAETARVRRVWRQHHERLREAVAAVIADWEDSLSRKDPAAMLRAALDGAATTSPQTAPAGGA